jgi:hypothetical protein
MFRPPPQFRANLPNAFASPTTAGAQPAILPGARPMPQAPPASQTPSPQVHFATAVLNPQTGQPVASPPPPFDPAAFAALWNTWAGRAQPAHIAAQLQQMSQQRQQWLAPPAGAPYKPPPEGGSEERTLFWYSTGKARSGAARKRYYSVPLILTTIKNGRRVPVDPPIRWLAYEVWPNDATKALPARPGPDNPGVAESPRRRERLVRILESEYFEDRRSSNPKKVKKYVKLFRQVFGTEPDLQTIGPEDRGWVYQGRNRGWIRKSELNAPPPLETLLQQRVKPRWFDGKMGTGEDTLLFVVPGRDSRGRAGAEPVPYRVSLEHVEFLPDGTPQLAQDFYQKGGWGGRGVWTETWERVLPHAWQAIAVEGAQIPAVRWKKRPPVKRWRERLMQIATDHWKAKARSASSTKQSPDPEPADVDEPGPGPVRVGPPRGQSLLRPRMQPVGRPASAFSTVSGGSPPLQREASPPTPPGPQARSATAPARASTPAQPTIVTRPAPRPKPSPRAGTSPAGRPTRGSQALVSPATGAPVPSAPPPTSTVLATASQVAPATAPTRRVPGTPAPAGAPGIAAPSLVATPPIARPQPIMRPPAQHTPGAVQPPAAQPAPPLPPPPTARPGNGGVSAITPGSTIPDADVNGIRIHKF